VCLARLQRLRVWGALVGYRGGKRIFLIRVRIQILVPVASSLYWAFGSRSELKAIDTRSICPLSIRARCRAKKTRLMT
jgi:hypothetical protein